ncbi:metal-dependent hydrolase [Halobacteriales archaeon Cl-PHB]
MMATTHALAGMLVGLGLAGLAPEATVPVVLAGGLGGFLPDLDMGRNHRKDLHAPVYGSVAALIALAGATLAPSPLLVALAAFLVAAAVHAVSDVAGGGLSLRPWAETTDRAVYSHYHGRWWRPRRWIPYDGSPADLALAGTLGLPVVVVGSQPVRRVAAGLLVVSMGYVVVRKQLPDYAESAAQRAPPWLWQYIPDRFLEG